jgi:serine/threonine protein kinase
MSASMLQDMPSMTSMAVNTGMPPSREGASRGSSPRRSTASGSRRRRSTTSFQATENVSVFQPGARLIDRYEVLRKIGQGGMSLVYEAFDEVRDEHVALKVLLPELAQSPRLQQRFLQEGRVSSSFSHPNIVRVFDLHETSEVVMISMELLSGSNLRNEMERRAGQHQAYRPHEVLSVIEQVCDALQVVHQAGVVHRDLKPENLWVGLDGTVKIMDFGISREHEGAIFTTGPRGSGTPYYIAPEQLFASPALDHRADQYSIAVIAYEMLTGEIPQGVIVPPHAKKPGTPRSLSKAVFQSLHSDPNRRFANMQAFAQAARFQTTRPRWMTFVLGLAATAALAGAGFGFQAKILPMFDKEPVAIWAPIDRQTVREKEPLRIQCRAASSALNPQQLVFRLLADAPEGATIDPSTGVIQWQPTEAQGPRDYKFQVLAMIEQDSVASVEERMIEVHVDEVADPPVFETPETMEAIEHEGLETSLIATDTNVPAVGLHYELVTGPAGMTVDPQSGKLQWTPNESDGESNPNVEVRVSLRPDDLRHVAATRRWNIRVEESIDPPEFTSPNTIRAEVGVPVSYRLTARDPNTPPLHLFYKLRNAANTGISLDPVTGELTWTPSKEQSDREFELVIEAIDDRTGQSRSIDEHTIKVNVAKYKEPEPPPQPETPKRVDPKPDLSRDVPELEIDPGIPTQADEPIIPQEPGGRCPKNPDPSGNPQPKRCPGSGNNASHEPPFEQPPFEQPPFEQPPFEQPPFEQPPFEQPPSSGCRHRVSTKDYRADRDQGDRYPSGRYEADDAQGPTMVPGLGIQISSAKQSHKKRSANRQPSNEE